MDFREQTSFLEAVASGNIFKIKSSLEGFIPLFKGDIKKIEEAVAFAIQNSDFDYEEDDKVNFGEGLESIEDKYNYEKGRLVQNFTKERLLKTVDLYNQYVTNNVTNNDNKNNVENQNKKGGKKMKTLLEVMEEIRVKFPALTDSELMELAKEIRSKEAAETTGNEDAENGTTKDGDTKAAGTAKEVGKKAGKQGTGKGATKETKLESDEDFYSAFTEFATENITAKTKVTAKVGAMLTYKFASVYGVKLTKVAKFSAAFVDYFTTEEGVKDVSTIFFDTVFLMATKAAKELARDYGAVVNAIDVVETVAEIKTAANIFGAAYGAYKYAKKNQDNVIDNILEFGSKEKMGQMLIKELNKMEK